MMNQHNFLISSVLILCSVSWTIDAQIFSFVKQYYECKNLKMTKSNANNGDEYYFMPDPNLENNKLDDSFYRRQRFDHMSLDSAMKLFKSIFAEVSRDCQSALCECVRKRKQTSDVEKYWIFFESEENLSLVKSTINSLDLTLGEDHYFFGYPDENFDLENYPALSEFAYNNDFTHYRSTQYFKYDECVTFNDQV